MSVEFTLTGCELDADGWDALLQEWSAGEELYGEACFVDGGAHLLGAGSIRGVQLLEGADGAIDVRLAALSSRADWRRAYAVIRRALERGGGTFTREDGEVLAAEALTPEAAEEAAVRDFCFAVQSVTHALSEGHEPMLPVGAFMLELQASDVPSPCRPEDVPAVEARLAERVARYAVAFAASTLVLGVAGKRVRLATWARIPTLVAADVHCVAVQGIEEPIPTERLLELVGARAERLGGAAEGGRIYLPELDEEADRELLASLQEASRPLETLVAELGSALPDDDPAEAGRARGGDAAALLADARRAARVLAEVLLEQGGEVEDAKRRLLREGVPEDTIGAVFGAAGVCLTVLKEEGGATPRAAARLAEAGLPPALVEVILAELGQAVGAQPRSPWRGCACLLLLALLAIGAAVALIRG